MQKLSIAIITLISICSCQGGEIPFEPRTVQTDAYISSDSGPIPQKEECNGFDDNLDGVVDEHCGCTDGQTQACFPGQKITITGICKMGIQTCSGTVEFGNWEECKGAILPETEICGDGIDQDCDGADLPCPPRCGDNECNGNEDCKTCPEDCGKCPPVCGDGECNGDENCQTCAQDCGKCPTNCETFAFGSTSRPTDIVWIVDQSGSMSTEIDMVKRKLNDFANYISQQAIDYHVIVMAHEGVMKYDVCIPPPLGGSGCSDGPHYTNINQQVLSTNSLVLIKHHINGIESIMRPNSMRHFVVVTDDNSSISATDFNNFISNRPGYQDYVFHGIIGLQSGGCVAREGTVYKELAALTGGKTFDICSADWTPLFNELGQKVADLAKKDYIVKGNPIAGTLVVKINGITKKAGVDYDYNASTKVLSLKGTMPNNGDTIEVCYEYVK